MEAVAERLNDAIGEVTLNGKSTIDMARSAYDALTPAQKKLVSNYQTLPAAEKRYDEITAPITPTGPSKPSRARDARHRQEPPVHGCGQERLVL